MNRNLMIAGGALLAAALLLYVFVFRPAPRPDPRLAQLADTAEQLCLSNVASSRKAGVDTTLDAINGIKGSASAGTSSETRRGAVQSLSGALQAQQNDQIRACMQPFITRMLQITQ